MVVIKQIYTGMYIYGDDNDDNYVVCVQYAVVACCIFYDTLNLK